MHEQTENTLRAAESATSDLLGDCRKGGAVYRACPKAAAQVNRNAKWLLHALTALRRELQSAGGTDGRPGA